MPSHLMAWNRLAFASRIADSPRMDAAMWHAAAITMPVIAHNPRPKPSDIEMTMQFIAFGPSGMLAAVQNATNRSQSCSVTTRLRSWLAQGARERLETDPSPIDPMVGNKAVRDIHHFDEVDLVALRCLARIFPDQLPAVGEERSGPIPAAKAAFRIAKSGLEERPDGGSAFQDALGPVLQDRQDKRGLEDGILGIERHQAIEIAHLDRLVPLFIDVADLGIGVLSHRRLLLQLDHHLDLDRHLAGQRRHADRGARPAACVAEDLDHEVGE